MDIQSQAELKKLFPQLSKLSGDLILSPQLRGRLDILAQAWGVSHQAALTAVIEDWIDNIQRDAEAHPDALMSKGKADPNGPYTRSIADLPEFGGSSSKD